MISFDDIFIDHFINGRNNYETDDKIDIVAFLCVQNMNQLKVDKTIEYQIVRISLNQRVPPTHEYLRNFSSLDVEF